MSQVQVRDTENDPIILVNYTVSLSDDPNAPYIDDFFVDYAGNSTWPRLGMPLDKPLFLHVNYFDKIEKFEYRKIDVPAGFINDIQIVLEHVIRPLQNIHIDGDIIRTDDGNQLIIAGCSNFQLAQLSADDQNIQDYIYKGPNFARLFMTHSIISTQIGLKPFHPDTYPNWLQACEDAIDKCNQAGQYVEANLICDNQYFKKDANFLRNMQNQFIEMFKNKKGIYSLGNENRYNGFDANDFSKPSGVISACGSGGTGEPAPLCNGQAWDLQFQHLRRDEKMFIDIPPVDAPSYHLNHRLLFDETIGFANYNADGKRTNNKDWAFKIGRIASAFNGAIIHIDSASHSAPLNGDEKGCLDAFLEGSGI